MALYVKLSATLVKFGPGVYITVVPVSLLRFPRTGAEITEYVNVLFTLGSEPWKVIATVEMRLLVQ